MDAHMRGTGAFGTDGVQQGELPVGLDSESTDGSRLARVHVVRFISGVQNRSGRIDDEAAGACSLLVHAKRRGRPGGAIHLEQVNAAAIAGRQVHLGGFHMLQRGTVGTYVSDERPLGLARPRQGSQERHARQHG